MSDDISKVTTFVSACISIPKHAATIVICLLMLYNSIGISAASGLLCVLVMIPITNSLSSNNEIVTEKIGNQRDERMIVMNEIIQSIRLVKMYAWENLFSKKVEKLRNEELKSLSEILKSEGRNSIGIVN